MPHGLKIFVEFSERFYPDMVAIAGLLETAGAEKTIYDVALGKGANSNVPGLFSVGDPSVANI